MNSPLSRFLVSSPYGDVPVDNDKLEFPLECDLLKTPYRVYLQGIKNFLEKDAFNQLLKAASKKCGRGIDLNGISEIIVRAEKHGALYHPASIELLLKDGRVKLGLNVAVSDVGKNWLKKEFSIIQSMNMKCNLPYLPELYSLDEQETMSFLLEEWFEGYHEFHLSMTESGKQCIKLWEFDKGYRLLSVEQGFEIYRQASKILTLYYDINDFSQIFPWHHAAGDFIVKVEDEGIDLRLTTARQYEPYMIFQDKESINPVIALFYFLLNLTIKMRLDKLDGVGDTVWAEDFCIEASIKGFLDGLRSKKELKDYLSSEEEFLQIATSFRPEDLKTAYGPLIGRYHGTGDYQVITANLDRHVEAFHAILRNFPS
jgi:hypothetical protein